MAQIKPDRSLEIEIPDLEEHWVEYQLHPDDTRADIQYDKVILQSELYDLKLEVEPTAGGKAVFRCTMPLEVDEHNFDDKWVLMKKIVEFTWEDKIDFPELVRAFKEYRE